MKVQEIMTRAVHTVRPDESISEAALRMGNNDVGVLPVVKDGSIVGIVTDRDITVRAMGARIAGDQPVSRIMSEDVATCSPNDEIEDALALMSNEQVRRVPVANDADELVGIVTLADAAERDPNTRDVIEALAEICQPTGLHSQAPVFA